MWALENNTSFAADRAWVRDKNGAEIWIVAVKATYLIKPNGTTTVAEKQEPVCTAPRHFGEPGKSSLQYETDLVRTKPTTDVLLHGHAYSRQKNVVTVDVMLKVANIQKILRVFGDRYWKQGLMGLTITKPQPFEKMPIVYERAFGGVDQRIPKPKKHRCEDRNPIGSGFVVKRKHLLNQRVPNVEWPKKPLWGRLGPAGFGPLEGHWSPRRELTGTYDEKWKKEKQPLLPDNFDDRFYQCAPEDQRTPEYLKGGEPVELYNLTPGGILKFTLPRLSLSFVTHFTQGEPREHSANLHSVIIEPDFPRVMMVWHTALPCHAQVNKLDKTVIVNKQST